MEVHTAQDRMINLLTCLGITVLWTQNLCIYQCARHCWGVAGNWIPVSIFLALHREITRTGLSGPQFHAALHNFTPPPGPAAGPSAAGALVGGIWCNFVNIGPRNTIQLSIRYVGNVNSDVSFQVNANFEQILFLWHTWSRSKGLRTIGSKWPDKRNKIGLTGGGGGRDFSHGQPPQENSVGSGVVWVTGMFSLSVAIIGHCLNTRWYRWVSAKKT